MAENEKDVPVKELEDGSLIAKIDLPEDIEEEAPKKVEASEESDDQDDDHQDDEDGDDDNDDETDDERERIREARREERRLKKDLKRQRDITAKNKIQALERRNEELARRLAAVENTAASYQIAQIDKALEDEATRVEYAKMKKIRKEYYLGNLDRETLEEYKWEQFDLKIGTKGNIDLYLESDDYLIRLLEKKAYYDECIFICEAIIKELNNRTWQLREYMSHTRFLAGN